MIEKKKITQIRQYLKKRKRVFINNIIVTLPHEVKPLSPSGATIDPAQLTDTAPIKIKLPDTPNSICVIDGQHRVFSYHETQEDDPQIADLRKQQNLLVTGIIYPEGISISERAKFEARLFLEINSTQTTAQSKLKQAIGVALEPFAAESIALKVMTKLSRNGPLAGTIELHFYETDKLKIASIVSYGLKPLVKTSGEDSLFCLWQNSGKSEVQSGKDFAGLELYVDFCVKSINELLVAIRKNVENSQWALGDKQEGKILSTTSINSFLIVLRLLIGAKHSVTANVLEKKFKGIENFDFSAFRSSQYRRMAEKLVQDYFGVAIPSPQEKREV